MVPLLESPRHDGSLCCSRKNGSQCHGRRACARCESGGGPDLSADARHYRHHRAGIARRQHLRIGGWRDVGCQAGRGFSAEVLSRGNSVAAQSDGAARGQVHPRSLGSGPLGTRVGDADVRIQRHAAGSSAGDPRRSRRARADAVGRPTPVRNLRYIKFMPDDSKPDDSNVIVRPARAVHGVIRIPGDKSISHRYAMLAAIAEGTSRFYNFSAARDCASTLDCVANLGCEWKRLKDEAEAGAIEVRGAGPQLNAPAEVLDCGNSGSTMRMLSGILAGQSFTSELCGDESLSRRPMARIMTPLSQMGARIEAAEGGRPPLKIHGGPLKPIHYRPEVASAQVKSCVLFAGLFAA